MPWRQPEIMKMGNALCILVVGGLAESGRPTLERFTECRWTTASGIDHGTVDRRRNVERLEALLCQPGMYLDQSGVAGYSERAEGNPRRGIYQAGQVLQPPVKLLISIRGDPAVGIGFPGRGGRSTALLQPTNGTLPRGWFPSVRSSGGQTRSGATNRRSRGLTRSLLTQAVPS